MKARSNPFFRLALAASILTFANAAQITWEGNSTTDLNTAANWLGGVAPVNNTDGILFGVAGSVGTDLTQNSNIQYTTPAMTYATGASSYTISGTGLITLGTGSIVNNSGVLQVINNNLKRNTGNSLTIGASGGMLEFNGTYDINATNLTQLSFGSTVGGVIAFNGGIVNTGAAATYGLTLPALTAPATGTVVLGGTNTALNGTVTRGSQTTLKLISAGALNSGQAVVTGATSTTNDTLWLASDTAVNAFNMTYSGGQTSKHNIILGTGSSGSAVTTQQLASLTIAGQQSTNFYKAGNVASGTPTLTVTGTTSILGEASARTTILGASGVNLVLGAVTSTVGAAQAKLTLDGNTSGSKVTGVIDNGLNGISLTKAGSGTWTLTNANTYLGATSVNGGTLNLDFNASGAPTSDILYNGVADGAIQLGGNGNFAIQGKDSTASSQTVGALSVKASQGGVITLAAGTSGSTTLNVASYAYTNGSVVNFKLGANTVFDNNAIIAAGAVGSGAFLNNSEYARYLADGTLTAAVVGNGLVNQMDPSNGGSTSSYYKQDGSHTRLANFTFKGIRLTNTGNNDTLDMGGFTLTASNSSILYRGGQDNVYNISNGTLAGGSTNLIFQVVSGATLNIASNTAMTGSGGFSKSGAGTVAVTGTKAYTGVTTVMEGVLSVDTLANGGANSGIGASTNVATNLRFGGGTLRYTGGIISTDRSFTIEGPGAIIDASGSGALTWAPAVAIGFANNDNVNANSASSAQNQSLTFTGTGVADNNFGSALGLIVDGAVGRTSVTKEGTGKWILTQANTYTGGTQISGGTLGITNAGALGTYGAVSFGGGTLQYGTGLNTDLSHRIQHSTGAISINTNGNNVSFQSRLDETNVGGLTKSGAGTLTLANSNIYSGTTMVSAGTLALGASGTVEKSSVVSVQGGAILDVSAKNGWTVGAAQAQKLTGSGTVTGAAIIGGSGTHNAGDAAVGKQTFSSSLTYNSGSIFEWDLNANAATGRGTAYDAVDVTTLTVDSGAIFKVVLGSGVTADPFWTDPAVTRTWNDIFSFTTLVGSFDTANIVVTGPGAANTGLGSFSISGTALTWTAVPEPTSALAGLLIAAGLLRRRRSA